MCRTGLEAFDGHSGVVAVHSCLTDAASAGGMGLGAPTLHLRWGWTGEEAVHLELCSERLSPQESSS